MRLANGGEIDNMVLAKVTDILIYLFTLYTGTFNELMRIYEYGHANQNTPEKTWQVLIAIGAVDSKKSVNRDFCVVLKFLHDARIILTTDANSVDWWNTLVILIDLHNESRRQNSG